MESTSFHPLTHTNTHMHKRVKHILISFFIHFHFYHFPLFFLVLSTFFSLSSVFITPSFPTLLSSLVSSLFYIRVPPFFFFSPPFFLFILSFFSLSPFHFAHCINTFLSYSRSTLVFFLPLFFQPCTCLGWTGSFRRVKDMEHLRMEEEEEIQLPTPLWYPQTMVSHCKKKQPLNGKKTGVRKKMHYCNRFSLVFDCWRTQQNCSLKGVFNKETDNEWKWTQKNGHKNILPPLSFKNATTIDITRTHIRIRLNKARDCLSLPHSTAQRGCVNVGQEALWLTWGFPSKETQEHMWQVFWYKIYHFV